MTNLAYMPAESAHPSSDLDAPEMLNAIVSFLHRYLICDDHQLSVLALWIVHTWCFQRFSTAAYLNVRSPEPQAGKTLCLELLRLLSFQPWHAAGSAARTLLRRLLGQQPESGKTSEFRPPCTIFLDDCHHTFGLSERQPLLAFLNSGSRADGRYVSDRSEHCIFGPKVFAGNAPLPRSLAVRCIPIVLYRKRSSDDVTRFASDEARIAAAGLLPWLTRWPQENHSLLAQAAESAPADLPPGLTPREQDCAEPLLHLADLIGGVWPQRARSALAAIFNLAESSRQVQLLADIRAIFQSSNQFPVISTRDLLAALATLEHRPWSGWPRNSGRRLGALLQPFGIVSRNFNFGHGNVLKCYRMRDFQDTWERYLPPLPSPLPSVPDLGSATKVPSATVSATGFSQFGVGYSG